jgi:hypothetical protein
MKDYLFNNNHGINMIKTMFKYSLFLTAFSLLFISCESDKEYYSLDDIWITLGFTELYENNSFVIYIDNGDTLLPAANDSPFFPVKNNQRVLVNYTILDEVNMSTKKFWVRINNLYEVLLKNIIELSESNNDSIGNDPVDINNIWISKNFLNVEFSYIGGEKVHFINLTHRPGEIIKLSQPVELELRHNSNSDSSKYNLKGIVSFDLKQLKIPDLDSVNIIVSSIDYQGKKQFFNGTYHY